MSESSREQRSASQGPTSGSLLERFLARLLDGLLVGIPLGIVLGVVLGIAGLADETAGNVLIPAILGVVLLAYYVHFESTTGQTIGKRVMNLRVVDQVGETPDRQAAIKRNLWVALSIFAGVPLLGILTGLGSLAAVVAIAVTISASAAGRGWHDELAGTRVTRIAP